MKVLCLDNHGSILRPNVYAVVGLLATTFDLAVTTYMVVAAENAGNVKGLPTHFLHSSLVPYTRYSLGGETAYLDLFSPTARTFTIQHK